jgi:hypothetical protein
MGIIVEDISTIANLVDTPKTQTNDLLTEVQEVSNKKEEPIDIPTQREVSLNDFDFRIQGFVSNEVWAKSFNLNARITKVLKDRITCECVIDKENKLFETRSFPRLLFDHLPKREVNHPIIVSIKTRPGSTRIDIRDGHNIVDLSIFDLTDGWKELINSGLDKPISFTNDSTDI